MPEPGDLLPSWGGHPGRKVLVLSSTPRPNGNSRCLADALVEGANAAGHNAVLVDLPVHVRHFLRDCRSCRQGDGACSIEDEHGRVLRELYLPAEAVVYATPIWWYGISSQLKVFIDRIFCHMSESCPDAADVVKGLMGKRSALLLSAEESNFAARLGIVEQISELSRYLHHDFVGVVTGIGNRRAEVKRDPSDPIAAARELGTRLFDMTATDYKIDTPRPKQVWAEGDKGFPGVWR